MIEVAEQSANHVGTRRDVVPQQRVLLTGAARFGEGGLGRHLQCAVEDAERSGASISYLCSAAPPDDPRGTALQADLPAWVWRWSPLRWRPDLLGYWSADRFDRSLAERLPSGDRFHGFAGMSLAAMRRARELGYQVVSLESGSVHIELAAAQQERANRDWPLERGWVCSLLRKKVRREYSEADEVWVPSQLAWDSMVHHGVPERKLRRRRLRVAERYHSVVRKPGECFRVVAVGGLSVLKGTPVLVRAFGELRDPDARLTLVGGWSSSGMRRFLERAMAADPRIEVAPGDPLPHLARASILAHPSYTDGLGLAPLEALACGVPVVDSDQTGMSEEVVPGVNGEVVPTGDWGALADVLHSYAERRPTPAERGQACSAP